MFQSIRYKLILMLITTSVAVGLIVWLVTPYMVKHEIMEHSVNNYINAYRHSIEHYIQEHGQWGTRDAAIDYARSADLQLVERVTEFLTMPVEFTLTDQNGHVLRETRNYQLGDVVSDDIMAGAKAIYIRGKILAYVAIIGELPLSPWERAYLHTLRESLALSVFIAVLTLLPFEIWRGNRLVNNVTAINTAVKNMANGELMQRVPVRSSDEMGQLAEAFNGMNKKLVAAYNDLSQSRDVIAQQAEQLKELSLRDELTGLYNRRYFSEEIEPMLAAARRYARPVSLVIGDIDFFKKINDNYSHATGDQVLKQVAMILQDQVRSSDLLARYGGEEMIIALPESSTEDALAQVERMRKIIEQFAWHKIADGLAVTISFGVASARPLETYAQLFDRADEQLYRAKEEGRNCICAV